MWEPFFAGVSVVFNKKDLAQFVFKQEFALLRLDVRDSPGKVEVFVKKVVDVDYSHKSWVDRKRLLMYIRNEARFYTEFSDAVQGFPQMRTLLFGSNSTQFGQPPRRKKRSQTRTRRRLREQFCSWSQFQSARRDIIKHLL